LFKFGTYATINPTDFLLFVQNYFMGRGLLKKKPQKIRKIYFTENGSNDFDYIYGVFRPKNYKNIYI